MKIINYNNGNANISLDLDTGTRTIECNDNDLKLEYPLNLDIRISSTCSFADNVCKDFCHELALVKGKDCDFKKLKDKLKILPKGIELAIGINHFNDEVVNFFIWCKLQGYIVNITINQGHLLRDESYIKDCMSLDIIKGVGISYRNSLKWNVPEYLLNYKHTIFNVIVGIDNIEDVKLLANKNVKKICVLGEKQIGYNANKQFDINKHNQWKWKISELFSLFEVTSFDNLAIEQLKIKRFFSDEKWKTFYNGEYSFYIDAVNEVFKKSSRIVESINWDKLTILEYFKSIIEK